jgi:hypothetical protein
MRVLRHPGELSALPSELRRLLERRLRQLQSDDWGEFILVEPGDGLSDWIANSAAGSCPSRASSIPRMSGWPIIPAPAATNSS